MCGLYKARWEIEVFFKQVKQTLRLSGFLGYSANAIRWQVWTALLVYVLLRFAAHLSQWAHSFTRLFAVVRAALWERLDALGATPKLWDSRRPVQVAGGGPTRVARRIPAIPDIIPWDSTAITPRAQPLNSQLGPRPIHPFPSGNSGDITLPMGCL